MIRKLLVVAAAIAMPVSVVAVSGGLAGASNSHTAATDSITCKDISGTVAFSPKLDKAGYTSGTVKDKITATVSGCTATGGTKETVTKGTVSGTISAAAGTTKAPTGKCTGLAGYSTDTGTLTITWAATPAAPPTKLGVKSVFGTTDSAGYGLFDIPGKVKSTASGSFGGANSGGSDKSVAQTKLKASSFLPTCLATGTSSLAITQESGVTAISLG